MRTERDDGGRDLSLRTPDGKEALGATPVTGPEVSWVPCAPPASGTSVRCNSGLLLSKKPPGTGCHPHHPTFPEQTCHWLRRPHPWAGLLSMSAHTRPGWAQELGVGVGRGPPTAEGTQGSAGSAASGLELRSHEGTRGTRPGLCEGHGARKACPASAPKALGHSLGGTLPRLPWRQTGTQVQAGGGWGAQEERTPSCAACAPGQDAAFGKRYHPRPFAAQNSCCCPSELPESQL